MGWVFVAIACAAAVGLFRIARSGADNRRYLEAGKNEAPLELDHLSAALGRFVSDTRLIRISLESSVRTIGQFIKGDLEATNDDRDGFDQMLLGVTRNLADWLATVDQLDESDRQRISDGGGNPAVVRSTLELEGWAFERRNLRMRGAPPMDVRLKAIMDELHKVETALQQRARIYR